MTDSQQPPTTKSSRYADGSFRSGKQHPKWLGSSVPELMGKQFGSVTLTSPQIHRVNGSRYVWAKCSETGTTKLTCLANLLNGKTTSFWANGRRPVKHAEVLGRRYDAIKARCSNPTSPGWKDYGGRGIKCLFTSRMEFIRWVSKNLPHENYAGVEIDRRNNDGHYEPKNLRLATRTEQVRNRRNTLKIDGMPMDDWLSPYSRSATSRMAKAGMSGTQIIQAAQLAVARKHKNWRAIAEWLARMT